MRADSYFTPALFKFLKDIRAHNNRDRFLKNKPRYEADVRDPFLRLIGDLRPGLYQINPHVVVDPSPSRGSMMRIYRDIRFAKDKSPYKTNIAAHFWHRSGKEGATPAYYLHIAPHDSLIGGGVWHPEPGALRKIREAIAADPKRWQRVTSAPQIGAKCALVGGSLERPPRGYDPGHACIEDIKRKDFAVGLRLADKDVLGPGFLDLVLERFRATAPFLQFLSKAVGLP